MSDAEFALEALREIKKTSAPGVITELFKKLNEADPEFAREVIMVFVKSKYFETGL